MIEDELGMPEFDYKKEYEALQIKFGMIEHQNNVTLNTYFELKEFSEKQKDLLGMFRHDNDTLRGEISDLKSKVSELMQEIYDDYKKNTRQEEIKSIYLKTIDELNLYPRTISALKADEIYLIGELIQIEKSNLFKIPNFGKKSLDDVREALARNDLSLATKLTDFEKDAIKTRKENIR